MMKVLVNDFLASIEDFADRHGICPRCGDDLEEVIYSSLSGVSLCPLCFCQEELPQFENYENWAVVCAVRAVCDTDIKIVKECVSKCC